MESKLNICMLHPPPPGCFSGGNRDTFILLLEILIAVGVGVAGGLC